MDHYGPIAILPGRVSHTITIYHILIFGNLALTYIFQYFSLFFHIFPLPLQYTSLEWPTAVLTFLIFFAYNPFMYSWVCAVLLSMGKPSFCIELSIAYSCKFIALNIPTFSTRSSVNIQRIPA